MYPQWPGVHSAKAPHHFQCWFLFCLYVLIILVLLSNLVFPRQDESFEHFAISSRLLEKYKEAASKLGNFPNDTKVLVLLIVLTLPSRHKSVFFFFFKM